MIRVLLSRLLGKNDAWPIATIHRRVIITTLQMHENYFAVDITYSLNKASRIFISLALEITIEGLEYALYNLSPKVDISSEH